jgi:ankyrin repeat protein
MGKKTTKSFRLGNNATSGKWEGLVQILKDDKKLNVDGTNTAGNSSLLIAAARGHIKAMAVLLGAGSDPNQRQLSIGAFHWL